MLKALLKIALLAICLLPTMSSCSGDDEPKTPEDNLPAETKKFVGFWIVESSSKYGVLFLDLFANGRCVAFTNEDGYGSLRRITGEWSYDTKTKMLSTSVGLQATTTLSTDRSWTGFSPSGTEYQCTRKDFTDYLFDGVYNKKYCDYYSNALAVEMIKKISAASNLTTDQMLDKLAKQAFKDDLGSTGYIYGRVIYHGYYMGLNDKDDYYIGGTYSYYVHDNYDHHEYEKSFTVAEGKILDISQTANGYKVKLTYLDETLELTVNPFK